MNSHQQHYFLDVVSVKLPSTFSHHQRCDVGNPVQKATSRFGILFPSFLLLAVLCLSLFLLLFPVASCSLNTINDLSLRLMIKITLFLQVEGEKEDECGYDTPGITGKKDSSKVEVIGSKFAYLIVFILSVVNQLSICKLSLGACSNWQPEERLHPKSRLIIPMAIHFKTWKENRKKKKIRKVRDLLFIISVLGVYLMRWFKHFEVKGSWSP